MLQFAHFCLPQSQDDLDLVELTEAMWQRFGWVLVDVGVEPETDMIRYRLSREVPDDSSLPSDDMG